MPITSAVVPATPSSRLILPSLEREVRRELTDRAEAHAVGVFAKNLRNLFLQPPVHNHRLLAVDPGFRSGCKLAALDEFGNLLGQGVIYLVGKPDRTGEARQKVLEMIEKHQLTVVAIGNGTACRHTENFFADLIENRTQGQGRGLRDRQRGRRQRLLDQPPGPRGVPAVRRHAARRDLDRPAVAGSAERIGQDRSGQHRRRACTSTT